MCTAEYNNNTDEELILRLRRGEEDIMEYLLNKYKNLVRSQAKSFYLKGGRRTGPSAGRHDWSV